MRRLPAKAARRRTRHTRDWGRAMIRSDEHVLRARRALQCLSIAIEVDIAREISEAVEGALAALLTDRERIAAILRTFMEDEISASSLQPVLDLASELNPDMRQAVNCQW